MLLNVEAIDHGHGVPASYRRAGAAVRPVRLRTPGSQPSTTTEKPMKFNILGAMQVLHEDRVCTPTAPKVRWTLAMLLLRANRIINTASLIDELWGENPPRSAVTTTQTYIYQLRKMFAQEAPGPESDDLILTQPPGYALRIREDQLDAKVFERLYDEGRELLARGDAQAAAARLRAALDLWRGPVLADVSVGRLLEAHVAHLEEMRIRALELRIEADNRLGLHRELLPELRSLVAEYPLNEWFHGELIGALNQAGRRGEALHAYQSLRRTLNRELGLEPTDRLQRLQEQLLTGADSHRTGTPVLSFGSVPPPRTPMAARLRGRAPESARSTRPDRLSE